MTDELVERLLDWPYQGETMAHEAADLIEQLTAERDRLRYERDAILLDGTVHSDQREKYERLCARIAAGKASQQDAVEAIRQLCRDNERLALRRSDARAEAAEAERDHAWAMVEKADTQMGQSLADHLQAKAERDRLRALLAEADRRIAWEAHGFGNDFAERVEAALKGESHD